jgi:diguanylate cyclase (GGDEF)-like protein/putative nucleotidyltransferase with HDIG domain
VDDEPSICEVVSDACRQAGLAVLTTTSAAQALPMLDAQAVHVMVCDLMMPDIDGIRLMERCAQRPDPPQTIVLTGRGSLETAQRALRLGAFDYVLKPFRIDDLLRRIQSAAVHSLDKRRPPKRMHKLAVLLTNPDGQIGYASPTLAVLLGQPIDRLPGTLIGQWLEPTSCQQIQRLIGSCGNGGRVSARTVLSGYSGTRVETEVCVQRALPAEPPTYVIELRDFEAEETAEDVAKAEWARNVITTDPLTGLCSHRYFQEELQRLRLYCQRYSHPLSLLLLDVDDFQQINRRLGHRFGDAVLRSISERLRARVRAADLLSRYGADEFVLLMPETPQTESIKVGRRLCGALSGERVTHGGQTVRVSVSGGLASCGSGFLESEEELVRRASEALKAAKRAGKDRLVTWAQVANTEDQVPADRQGIEQMTAQFEAITAKLKSATFESSRALVAAVEAKDPYTSRHSVTVALAAAAIARAMGLDGAQVESIQMAATLHDIGKIGIPDQVLTKPGALTDEEYELIKQHPVIGASILEHVSLFRAEVPIIRHHHERWDGRGYPAGLAGERIPTGARILAVCDALDAMLSDRAYRQRLPIEEARRQLDQGAGTQFDPRVVEAALQWLDEEGAELYEVTDRPRQAPAASPQATPWPGSASSGPN